MKFRFVFLLVVIANVSNAQTKLYRFIGQLQACYTYTDSGNYYCSFRAITGETKEFIHLNKWPSLKYDLQSDLLKHKWFEINYYGVYEQYYGHSEKAWLRKIQSFRMIPDLQHTRTYRFIGKFQESDFADGYYSYTFVGVSGKRKEFIQFQNWAPLTYNLERRLAMGKWFEIFYYGVYDGLGDDEEQRWFRRIKSIKMIPIPRLKQYTFTGRFKAASVLEGSGYYTFIGLNGKEKDFAHDIEWSEQKLPYELFEGQAHANEAHVDKWFRITYYGVYGTLSGEDGAPNSWHRKIYTIDMIPIPRSKDITIKDTSMLYDFNILKKVANFSFQDGPNSYVQMECDTSILRKFPFDFSSERVFAEEHSGRQFEFQYKIEYTLETEEPVIRKILSLKILE
jgi:hypothetical protein